MHNAENSKSLSCSVRNEIGFSIKSNKSKIKDSFSGDIESDDGYMHKKSKRKRYGN